MNLGRGGTGFVATSGAAGCGLEYCPSFPEMVDVAIASRPDVVVVAGGRNDGDRDNAAAIAATFAALRDGLPAARIIAISPIWDASPYPDRLMAMGETIREAVEGVGGEYLDVGSPLAGQLDLMTADGVHPNAAGYAVLGAAVNAALAR